jgi:hypothetical protein
MDFNVYLAEKLVEMRIAEMRAAAERGRLLASARAQGARRRVRLGSVLIGAARWLAGALAPHRKWIGPWRV